MSILIMTVAIIFAKFAFTLAIMLAGWRIFRGPRAQDRVLAIDTVYMNSLLLLLTLGISNGSAFFFEAALVIGALGFVSSVALAKFLMRGEVIE